MHLEKNYLKAKPTRLTSELKVVQVGILAFINNQKGAIYYIVVHSYNLIVGFQNTRICRKISVEEEAS